MSKVLIVGGGAAGMFASIFAAKNGNEVHVFEKNEKLGKKLRSKRQHLILIKKNFRKDLQNSPAELQLSV